MYKSNLETVSYFEKTALPNAAIIYKTAYNQFNSGEINYLEWAILTNQSIAIQSNYLDAIRGLNESIIAINYLTSTK
jgi:cobalt-zinc-cadmium resistance protein CzcA